MGDPGRAEETEGLGLRAGGGRWGVGGRRAGLGGAGSRAVGDVAVLGHATDYPRGGAEPGAGSAGGALPRCSRTPRAAPSGRSRTRVDQPSLETSRTAPRSALVAMAA